MQALKFEGNGLEYFKIWIVNILLTIITLTLYYPWAKVRHRRYFYGNSTLNGQNFEYHATGKQLFVGYLIAMSILIAFVIMQQVSPIGGLVVILAFSLAIPWIIWRSLIFNMRVTSYSNVHFSFNGSLGGAYFNYLLMPILVFLAIYASPIVIAILFSGDSGSASGALITLLVLAGIALAIYAYAVLKKRNASYFVNSTRFGQGQFSADLKVGPFVMILLKTIGLSLLAILACLLLGALVSMLTGASDLLLTLSQSLDDPEAVNEVFASGAVVLAILSAYLGFIFVGILLFSYAMSRQRAYIYANSTLDGRIGLASTVGARGLAWVSITNLLLVLVTLGLALPWAKVRMARYLLEHTEVDTSADFSHYVSEKLTEQSSLGEQIGDAFDVDVGIGI